MNVLLVTELPCCLTQCIRKRLPQAVSYSFVGVDQESSRKYRCESATTMTFRGTEVRTGIEVAEYSDGNLLKTSSGPPLRKITWLETRILCYLPELTFTAEYQGGNPHTCFEILPLFTFVSLARVAKGRRASRMAVALLMWHASFTLREDFRFRSETALCATQEAASRIDLAVGQNLQGHSFHDMVTDDLPSGHSETIFGGKIVAMQTPFPPWNSYLAANSLIQPLAVKCPPALLFF